MFSYTEVVWDRYTDVRRILRTPNDCHAGKGEQILNKRNQIIAEEQQKLGRCIQINGYALPKKVGLMRFAAKRKQIEKNVKNREYSQGSKQVA